MSQAWPSSLITGIFTGTLVWNEETSWISWQRTNDSYLCHLCWLPVERRGDSFAYQGTTAVIGTRQGVVTILDFSDVITMLKGLDQAPSHEVTQ
jgi:hypothetical protein